MANKRDVYRALQNRLEHGKAECARRALIKMGLMTSAGVLIAKDGLAGTVSFCFSSCSPGCSAQPRAPFIDPLPIPPQLPARSLTDPGLQFGAPPQLCPNNAINAATNLPFEGRGQFNGTLRAGSDCFQFFTQHPPPQSSIQRIPPH